MTNVATPVLEIDWPTELLKSLHLLERDAPLRAVAEHIERCEPIFEDAPEALRSAFSDVKSRLAVRRRTASA